MAVGPFSITPGRQNVIDFTVPFMEDGGGILTKGGEPGPDLLNTFRPFSFTVWLLLAVSVVVTAVILFVITKMKNLAFFAVTNWHQPWTFAECLWVIYGSLVSQGGWMSSSTENKYTCMIILFIRFLYM